MSDSGTQTRAAGYASKYVIRVPMQRMSMTSFTMVNSVRSTHVVLVHGTRLLPWSKQVWVDKGPLVEGLDARGLSHEAFRWSGFNGHRARIRAADSLAAMLEESKAKRPNFRHVVVAHSHGGNVALHALHGQHRPEVQDVKLVTLATPFIHLTGSGSGGAGTFVAVILVGLAVFAGWALPIVWIFGERFGSDPSLRAVTPLRLAFFALAVLFTVLWFWSASEEYERIDAPPVEDSDTTVIRSVGDEATLALAASDLSLLLSRGVFTALIALFVLGALGLDVLGTDQAAAYLVVALVTAGAIRLVSPCFFGVDGMGIGVSYRLTAETSPPGESRAVQLPPRQREPGARLLSWLSHSSLYQDANAIEVVITEIENQGALTDEA